MIVVILAKAFSDIPVRLLPDFPDEYKNTAAKG